MPVPTLRRRPADAARAAVPALVIVALTLASACAAARARPILTARLAETDTLTTAGCYSCLTAALAGVQALAPFGAVTQAALDARVFRLSLLIALREKELGLDPGAALGRARTLLARLPVRGPAADQLRWAELLPSNPSALGRDASEAEHAAVVAVRDEVTARLRRPAAARADLLDAYLDLSLACAVWFDRSLPTARSIADGLPPTPLLQWRLGSCGVEHASTLAALVASEPRFVEAAYVRGRYLMARAADPRVRRDARQAFAEAHASFPTSPAIAMDLAGVVRTSSFRDALPLYRAVTTAVPDHNDAWLGVTLCLSYLRRHSEAADAATRTIALGRWRLGDAYYWRAWNRHQLTLHDLAWDDVQEAKRTLYTTDVFGLAGIIAYDRGELDVARVDLERARMLSHANCAAAWYLGLVHVARERWDAGGQAFEAAERCYTQDAELARGQKAAAEGSPDEPETRAQRIAEAEAIIREAEAQAGLAAYNAGYGYVRAGAGPRARPLLERALAHPAVADKARVLLDHLDR